MRLIRLNMAMTVEQVTNDTLVVNDTHECSEPLHKRQRLDSSFVTSVSDSGDVVSDSRDEAAVNRDRVSFGASEGSGLEEIRLPAADIADATPAVAVLTKVYTESAEPLPTVPEAKEDEAAEVPAAAEATAGHVVSASEITACEAATAVAEVFVPSEESNP